MLHRVRLPFETRSSRCLPHDADDDDSYTSSFCPMDWNPMRLIHFERSIPL